MKSSIYVSTEQIEVIGYAGRKVKRYVTYPLPEGTVINGMITDSAFLTECLAAMRLEHPGLFRSPSLIVDGSSILSRRLITPKLNRKRYLQMVRDDFADSIEDSRNLVCGYYKLGSKDEEAILACAVDKGIVDAYISAFRSAGIKLDSIRVGAEALINMIDARAELKKASFVLTLIDGFTSVSMIFENGNNVFMSRARLYGDTKEQVFQNVLDNLNGLINFNRSQKFSEITQCYYIGVNDADIRLIDALSPYAGIAMDGIDLFGSKNRLLPLEAHFAYLNIIMPPDSIDLMKERKELDKHIKRSKPKKVFAPLLLLYILILALPIAYFWWQGTILDQDIGELNRKINNPANEERLQLLMELESRTEQYRRVNDQFTRLIDWEDSLTEVSGEMLDLFFIRYIDLAAVERFEYDRNTNTVRITALSYDQLHPGNTAFIATRYVDSLKESGIVMSIPFAGYEAAYSGSDYIGTRISIEARLAVRETADGEAD
jgi:hypothetical protein